MKNRYMYQLRVMMSGGQQSPYTLKNGDIREALRLMARINKEGHSKVVSAEVWKYDTTTEWPKDPWQRIVSYA